jgi:hypothetical protein
MIERRVFTPLERERVLAERGMEKQAAFERCLQLMRSSLKTGERVIGEPVAESTPGDYDDVIWHWTWTVETEDTQPE